MKIIFQIICDKYDSYKLQYFHNLRVIQEICVEQFLVISQVVLSFFFWKLFRNYWAIYFLRQFVWEIPQ